MQLPLTKMTPVPPPEVELGIEGRKERNAEPKKGLRFEWKPGRSGEVWKEDLDFVMFVMPYVCPPEVMNEILDHAATPTNTPRLEHRISTSLNTCMDIHIHIKSTLKRQHDCLDLKAECFLIVHHWNPIVFRIVSKFFAPSAFRHANLSMKSCLRHHEDFLKPGCRATAEGADNPERKPTPFRVWHGIVSDNCHSKR
jgi:hypothetical protein